MTEMHLLISQVGQVVTILIEYENINEYLEVSLLYSLPCNDIVNILDKIHR